MKQLIKQRSTAAQQCFEYLKPGGYLRVAIPDGFHPDKEYINYVKPGGTGSGSNDHKVLYNRLTFAQIFINVGFDQRNKNTALNYTSIILDAFKPN